MTVASRDLAAACITQNNLVLFSNKTRALIKCPDNKCWSVTPLYSIDRYVETCTDTGRDMEKNGCTHKCSCTDMCRHRCMYSKSYEYMCMCRQTCMCVYDMSVHAHTYTSVCEHTGTHTHVSITVQPVHAHMFKLHWDHALFSNCQASESPTSASV